jgi:hypothetical protein
MDGLITPYSAGDCISALIIKGRQSSSYRVSVCQPRRRRDPRQGSVYRVAILDMCDLKTRFALELARG